MSIWVEESDVVSAGDVSNVVSERNTRRVKEDAAAFSHQPRQLMVK